MKIACSSTSLVPSETANSIQVLMACEGLARCGADITLCVPGSGEVEFGAIRKQYGLRCDAFPIYRLVSSPALKRLDFAINALRKASAEVIYTWTIQIAVLAALCGRKTAYEVHDLPTGGGKRWFDFYTRLKASKTIIPITAALRDKLLILYPGLRSEDCVISPNAVNLEDYADLPNLSDAKRTLEFPMERLLVSCSGHLYQGRGSDLFLRLAECFPDADFRWFGGNPAEVETCRTLAASKDLRNVFFHGFISKDCLPLYQAASDIVLMPYSSRIAGSSGGNSAEICSPMKMFEYLACGRCILSADLPVIHEILDDRCAIFCVPDDPLSWETGLRRVLESAELRDSLAEEAQRRGRMYTWDERARKILDHLIGDN